MSVSTHIVIKDDATKKLERIAAAYARVEGAARATNAAIGAGAAASGAGYDNAAGRINAAGRAVDSFNQRQAAAAAGANRVRSAWSGVGGMIRSAVAAAAVFGLTKAVGLSDQMASTRGRMALIVDDEGSVAELEQKIMASAQRSRAAYLDTAGAVTKLAITAGDAFQGNDEIIAFTELMNKNFVVAGASTQEQASAMYQLTQAMGSGRLQGDEYRSIIENAPLLATAIEDYMRNVQGATGSMKDWASAGLLTADVIKAALFSTAEEIEDRFSQMPMTWAQVWDQASNIALQMLQPLLNGINGLANNISIVGPLVMGLGITFAVFQVAAHWTQIAAVAAAIYHGVVNFLTIGFGILTGNAAAASAAVFTFNSALLANPVVWVVMLIIVLIAALYAGVAAYNKFTDSAVSATGIIAGAFAVLGAHIANRVLIPLWNGFAAIVNFIGNVFNRPIASIKILFYDMVMVVLGYFRNLATGIETLINKIPGMQVNITGGLDDLYAKLEAASQKVKDESEWVEYVQSQEFIDYGDAAKAGYDFGVGIENKVRDLFGFGGEGISLPGEDPALPSIEDTAANTGAMAEEVNIADEDLKFMRDMAEMRYVQNFVTLTPTVSMNASITEAVDIGGVVSEIERRLEEEFTASAEGVYT